MIGYLKGTVLNFNLDSAIILAGDVGYEVKAPSQLLSKLKTGEEISVFVHTHVREDQISLFAFEKKEEHDFFKLLISVSGIGPKVALAIVSSAPIEKLKESISRGDSTLLSAVSGVGKKTAEKAVIELRNKVGESISQGGGFGDSGEVLDALLGLGFQRSEALAAITSLPPEIEGTDSKIKASLRLLGK
jgi:holliday junction DNA helicase RuvA